MPGKIPTERSVVLVDSYSSLYDSVFIDNVYGGYLAGKKLSQFNGETYVIMMNETVDTAYFPVFHSRLKGFKKALSENDKTLPTENIQVFVACQEIQFEIDEDDNRFRGDVETGTTQKSSTFGFGCQQKCRKYHPAIHKESRARRKKEVKRL